MESDDGIIESLLFSRNKLFQEISKLFKDVQLAIELGKVHEILLVSINPPSTVGSLHLIEKLNILVHVDQLLGILQLILFLSILKYSILFHVLREVGSDHHNSFLDCGEPKSKLFTFVQALQLLGNVQIMLLLLNVNSSISIHVDQFEGSTKSESPPIVHILKYLIFVRLDIPDGKGQVIQ